jgi:hypothetical protein
VFVRCSRVLNREIHQIDVHRETGQVSMFEPGMSAYQRKSRFTFTLLFPQELC